MSGWALIAALSLAAIIMLGGSRRARIVAPSRGNGWARLSRPARGLIAGRPDGPTPGWRLLGALAACLAVLVGIGFSTSGVLVASLAGVAAFVITGRFEGRAARLEREALEQQLDGVIELLAAALRAGSPLRVAVQLVAAVAPQPTGGFLERVGAGAAIGLTDAEAWSSLGDHPLWGPIARDLMRDAESGAGVVDMLLRHSEDLRRARGARIERRARTVGVRSVLPLMCCFLPAFILVGVVPIIMGTIGTLLPN